jgi:hypothetical protein
MATQWAKGPLRQFKNILADKVDFPCGGFKET